MKRDVKPGFRPAGKQSEIRQKSPGKPRLSAPADGWAAAVQLTERWLAKRERVDSLLEQLTPALAAQERARAQHLFFGVVRWFSRIETAVDSLLRRAPRNRVRAVLFVVGCELLDDPAGSPAPVVHHAVQRAKELTSPAEAGLINAVGRKLAERLATKASSLAAEFAHPDWLVERWSRQFGPDATRRLLEWNQSPAPVRLRWRRAEPPPEFLEPTRWAGYFSLKPGHWDEVRRLAAAGALYIQDPSTRICVDLLAPQKGEDILDACAAPGGKSLLIADALAAQGAGRVVAVDLEGPRIDRLRDNLALAPAGITVALLPADLAGLDRRQLAKLNLPESYDAALLDAPCTNSGVMRHRVDVKWRLREGDFSDHAKRQLVLLKAVARLVREGGRLVYSTCSIDPEENENLVAAFLGGTTDWKLERQAIALPWIDGHDGAAAFLLRRAPAK